MAKPDAHSKFISVVYACDHRGVIKVALNQGAGLELLLRREAKHTPCPRCAKISARAARPKR